MLILTAGLPCIVFLVTGGHACAFLQRLYLAAWNACSTLVFLAFISAVD
jgi:hypothetical protein